MRAMPITRITNPTRAQLDECVRRHQPAILSGVLDREIATRAWDVPYLRAKLGDREVDVVSHDRPRIYWDPQRGLPTRRMAFNQFADGVFTRRDPGFSYLQDDVNSFPVIKDDYRLPAMMADKQLFRAKFWLSGPGLITPLHYDPVETFHWVIRGSKRFICYRPGVRRFYPFAADSTAPFISQVDPDQPDLARFPRFAGARPVELTVNAGELLYLPAFWWHQVYSEGAVNLSLNFVWFASRLRCLRHYTQFSRARRHIAMRLAQVRAQEQAARRELGVRASAA
jgi:lysine-specific demethylase 8